MSDLIDRQAAIDMFQNLAYDDWNQGTSTTWANAFAESADMIEELPPAQDNGEDINVATMMEDETLNVTADVDITRVKRILLTQKGTQNGGLYYRE